MRQGTKPGARRRLVPAIIFVLLGINGYVNAGAQENTPGAGNTTPGAFPAVNLPDKANGQGAIAALGDKLPAVAAWYGMSPAEFAQLLRDDQTAWIDIKGRLFYIDHFPQQAGEEGATDPLEAAQYPLEDTFLLNSKPGAQRVIYLDFDGHTITGTAWNASYRTDTIESPPYSRDSDPAFSNSELADIQRMWRQVAEDFAPFDVNVTTQDPGQAAITRSSSSDAFYGTRVVITDDNFASCGCGGFAYLTAFNDVGDYYKPAFVFNSSLVGAGEAITHEAGHNLSLHHDGTDVGGAGYYTGHGSGATGWAPIMGVGYYQPLVQWSQGEYFDASETEDDIARIAAYGAPLVADDHGDSETAATPLAASGNGTTASLSTSGLISLRDDVDVFSFVSGAGPFSLSVDPAPFAPNLDIRAELYDSAGGLVASSNPADSLPAVLSGTLAAGEYFLFVDGVGKGDPLGTGYTDYGSLGRYAVAGTVADPGGLAAPAAVISTAYQPDYAPANVSLDGSGSNDSDGTVEIWDWDFGDGSSGTGVTANHTYAAPGDYTVTLTVTDDDGLTGSDSITVTVLNRAPVAVASASSTGGQAPLPVAFTGSSSYDPDNLGAITTWAWDFGDGASADTADANHTYNSAGTFVASLTVTDNRGDSDSATVTVSVSPPALLDQYASADEFGAGTVSGSYLDTHDLDGSVETILERESGGRKSSRYSYLEHAWLFNVAPGDLVTLAIAAWQDSSSDGDQMGFEYSLNGGDYTPVGMNLGTSPVGATTEIALPPDIAAAGGALRVRVVDSDQTANNRSLDAVYVDQIVVRTENQGGGTLPPEPASGLAATAISSSRIDLAWLDGSTTETGFRIERSQDGVPWAEVATVGANVASFSDQGLKAATTYFYRVWSFNSAGDATVASNTDQGTTAPASAITLSASGYKVKGIQYVDLNWGGADGADVYRDSALVATVNAGNSYTDNIGAKGGGSYSYQVCEKGTSDCSAEEAVVF